MKAVIRTFNLGKKYELGGESGVGAQSFRELISDSVRNAFRPKTREATNDFWALSNVTFEIKAGDRVGIIGKNGAGKSTLLKILSQITQPTTGKVEISGRLASLLEVGTGFHPDLSGRENVYLNGAILGMSKREIRRKFDEIVSFAEVEKFIDTPIKRYSSGMHVRLAFSVAAHLEPEILILDEVLAVGDARFQRKCAEKIKSVGAEGKTIIFVSHNLGQLKMICKKGIYLKNGMLHTDSDINTALEQYHLDSKTISASVLHTSKCGSYTLETPFFINSNGSRTEVFPFNSSAKIRFNFEFKTRVDKINPGFSINSLGGDRIFTVHLKDDPLSSGGPFLGKIGIECLVSFAEIPPGTYMVDFGVRDENGENSIYDSNSQLYIEITSDGLPYRDAPAGAIWRTGQWRAVQ